jgi:hypothetical protein
VVGQFNNWDPKAEHWAFKNPFGVWELFLPDAADGSQAIPHRRCAAARLLRCAPPPPACPTPGPAHSCCCCC